jgi:hypothetical protein
MNLDLDYIDVHEPKTGRKSSLGFGYKRGTPGCLSIVGGLSHNTEITFDRQNAEKLVKWLQDNILTK